MIRDPVLFDDWHPVGMTAQLPAGIPVSAQLLDVPLVVWRDSANAVHVWVDRCPHRGMKLSLGSVHGDSLTCAYHGWTYGSDGRCKHIPALPEQDGDRLTARVSACAVQEQYGLIWVCLGTAARGVPAFPEFTDRRLRKVWCGPYEVASSGPRIVENFLDMAHFAFVHEGILGEKARAAIREYQVQDFADSESGDGIRATGCLVWQPRSNSLASGGSEVEYSYRVVRPLTAILTKEPLSRQGFHEAVSLHLQPLTETTTRVWIILALTNHEQGDEELRAFQDAIFLQDRPIVENQQPLRLPLLPGAEVSVACDRMSLAYRRYLKNLGLRYGVVTSENP
ncbi:MAG: aromatic ring-hydroxylating dioxygenase subunit alpha [Betaproteobacteria bacterium]|nr:aromatic ring-hydroxylating dioxygenase subunit alpha [Betaproteobacteria bacterium]